MQKTLTLAAVMALVAVAPVVDAETRQWTIDNFRWELGPQQLVGPTPHVLSLFAQVSNDPASPMATSQVILEVPSGFQLGDVNRLSLHYFFQNGGCGFDKSPRVVFDIDTNGDAIADGTVNATFSGRLDPDCRYLHRWGVLDFLDGRPRFDARSLGGPAATTLSGAVAALPADHEVMRASFQYGGAKHWTKDVQVWFDDLRLNTWYLAEPQHAGCSATAPC